MTLGAARIDRENQAIGSRKARFFLGSHFHIVILSRFRRRISRNVSDSIAASWLFSEKSWPKRRDAATKAETSRVPGVSVFICDPPEPRPLPPPQATSQDSPAPQRRPLYSQEDDRFLPDIAHGPRDGPPDFPACSP